MKKVISALPLKGGTGHSWYARPAQPTIRRGKPVDGDLEDLFAMHDCTRKPGTKIHDHWIERWISSIPNIHRDIHNNWYADVGKRSETIFTSHTDTMGDGKKTSLVVKDGVLRNSGGVLGADDSAGCWIMRRMILAGVPGLYVFHDSEERGGIGSDSWVRENESWLKLYKRCISFDRKGYDDVITHQSYGTCCSDAFAEALSAQLNGLDTSFRYQPCDGGTFTDSAHYMETVAECTNLSVGYFNQHTPHESLDMYFCHQLMTACCKVDWESLPTKRDKTIIEDRWSRFSAWEDPYDWRYGISSKAVEAVKEDEYFQDEIDWVLSEVAKSPDIEDILILMKSDAKVVAATLAHLVDNPCVKVREG